MARNQRARAVEQEALNEPASIDAFDRDAQRTRKRTAVLRVAAAAFNSRGFERTSLDDVASALRISKPALYKYFKNKEDILYECHLLAMRHGEAAIAEARSLRGSGLEKLLAYFRRYLKGFLDELGSCAVLLDVHSLADEHRDEILKRRAAVATEVEHFVATGVRDGSVVDCKPKLAALYAFGVINWVSVWYRADGANTPDEIVEEFAKFFDSGFAKRPREYTRQTP